ncbi:hypothetical protein FB451DRAFT_1414474 [Mycena latifolia]|nr:hypothetical protein FB451DRAFT_1414474 [Mycena latifolia]
MPPKPKFLSLTNPSARAQNAYSLLPDSLKPINTQVKKKCPHSKKYTFSIVLGRDSPESAGNVMAYTPCTQCKSKYQNLNEPTPEERESFLIQLAQLDEAGASPASPAVQSRAKPAAKAPITPAKSKKPAEGKPAPTIGKSKATATPDITPARKKTKLGATEVSPAVPAPAKLLAPVPRNFDVHLFIAVRFFLSRFLLALLTCLYGSRTTLRSPPAYMSLTASVSNSAALIFSP